MCIAHQTVRKGWLHVSNKSTCKNWFSDEDLPLDAYRCSRTQHSICNSLIYALLEFICLCMCFIIFILVSKCGILSFIAVARSLKTRNTRQKS